ncbi:Hint domain-containing protein [Roseococcus sp. YIM B11640]|uniref:Hint domain-containing protein n=1 Tax=Roseococcus sp. YIM B11640 TaxID=3133973 RepID=UPI003C79936A
MATYSYNQSFGLSWNSAQQQWQVGTGSSQVGTLNDIEGDGTFELNDMIYGAVSPPNLPFGGTVSLAGRTYVILGSPYNPSGNIYLFGNYPNMQGPPPFNPSQVMGGAFLTCFLEGTRIVTPDGERAVEDLAIGDSVLTADGRSVPVRWMGRQTVVTAFGPPANRGPVSIAPGALGGNLPRRELRVTSDHALLLDGVLIHAGALVNGTTIRRMGGDELGERFTVHHIETAEHEIILAEGAPTETFLDTVTRRRFDNHDEYVALHGEDRHEMAGLDYPRVKSVRQLPRMTREKLGKAVGLAAVEAA